jgi:hypothetical protein
MIYSSVRKFLSLGSVMALVLSATELHATTMQIDARSSFIHVTGGDSPVDEYWVLSGSFDVEINGDQLLFNNLNINIQGQDLSSEYAQYQLFTTASYDGLNFKNGNSCPAFLERDGICPAEHNSGTFDGNNFFLAGYYWDEMDDGFFYTTELHASAVPIPSSAWLLGSSLIGISGMARRKRCFK